MSATAFAEGDLTEMEVIPATVDMGLPTGTSMSNAAITKLNISSTETRSAEAYGAAWLGDKSSNVADGWYVGVGNGNPSGIDSTGNPLYTYGSASSFSSTARGPQSGGGWGGTYNACVLTLEDVIVKEGSTYDPETDHYFHISFATSSTDASSGSNSFALFGWNGKEYKLLTAGATAIDGTSSDFEVNVSGYDQVVAIWGLYGSGATNSVTGLNATMVPEPATATLSLVVLAGLAARRRRK